MKFYTYVWLRKKTLSPYYVGKGKEDRAYDNRLTMLSAQMI